MTLGLYLGFFSCCSGGYIDHRDVYVDPKYLGETHGEPNGLVNNELRCYANSSLQLLAACFEKEVKSIPRDPRDGNKNLLRDSLLMIVDHINAKKKRAPCGEVLQAVRTLTDFPDIAKASRASDGRGGCIDDFIGSLNNQLGFLPVYELMYHKIEFSSSIRHDGSPLEVLMVSHTRKNFHLTEMFFSYFIPDIRGLYRSGDDCAQLLSSRRLSVKEMEDLRMVVSRKLRQPLNGPISDGMRQLHQSVRGQLQGDSTKLVHEVEYHSFRSKLPAGSKILLSGGGHALSSSRFGMSIDLPYGKDPGHLQKFDLIGAAVTSSGHCVAYIKRKGTWYLANDSCVSKVSGNEKGIKQLFEGWSKARDGSIFAIYKARD